MTFDRLCVVCHELGASWIAIFGTEMVRLEEIPWGFFELLVFTGGMVIAE